MASEKQIAANRRNASRSTGPKTAEGKGRMRLNALKHGLTADTVVLPGEDAAVLEARVDAWKDDVRPSGALEDYLVERAAHASWQLDRADRIIAARLTERMRQEPIDRAAWETEELDTLARALFWDPLGPIGLYPHVREPGPLRRLSWTDSVDDPIDPARIIHRLEAFAAGCRWLIDRWGDLRKLLEDGRPWQAPDRLRAVRLLGKQPMDALDDERVLSVYLACRAMDPEGPSAFADLATEMHTEEAKILARRAAGRDVTGRTPAGPEAGKAVLTAIIEQVVTRLEILMAVRRENEAEVRPRRLDFLAFDDSEDGERLRRYQQARERALFRTIGTLTRVRKEVARDPGDDPARRDARSADDAQAPALPIAVECPIGVGDETNPFADPTGLAGGCTPTTGPQASCPPVESSPSVGPESSGTRRVADVGPTAGRPDQPDPVRADPADGRRPRAVGRLCRREGRWIPQVGTRESGHQSAPRPLERGSRAADALVAHATTPNPLSFMGLACFARVEMRST
jgi:hypothetical protein